MYVVFVEYVIFPLMKNEYLECMTVIKQNNPSLELLESADEEGLFLEVWRNDNEESLKWMQVERVSSDHATWAKLNSMVDTSRRQIRIWWFINHIGSCIF